MIRRAAPFAVLFALTAFAQQQTQPLTESIDVQLTNLTVVVTDRSGARIGGLTANDFEVLENGVRREITNLSEVRRGPAAESLGGSLDSPRRILVAVDNRTIPQSARKKTITALRTTIDPLLSNPSDRLMVVTISGSSKQRTGWTSDRAEIARVLTEIEQEAAAPRLEEAEINNMFNDLMSIAQGNIGGKASHLGRRPVRAVGSAGVGEDGQPAEDPADQRLAPAVDYNVILTRARAFAASRHTETRQTLGALTASLNGFQAAPGGRRLVVLVGGAMPLFAGADIFQRLDTALKDIEKNERRTSMSLTGGMTTYDSPLTEKTSFDLSKDVDALATSARLKGIAFYAVNPETNEKQARDSTASHASTGANDFSAINATTDGFQRLAIATGGESHIGRSAEIALTDIQRDLDTYYAVGYRSTSPVTPETKIVVKAKGGLTARATLAQAALSPEWQVADQVLSMHFTESASNDLGINLVPETSAPAPDGSRKMVVRVMIPFDRLTVQKEGSEYLCAFSVFVSVGDATGGAQPQQETRNFKWNAETVEKLRGKSIAYGVNLTVGPGRDRVSVGMLDLRSGKTGYARTVLQ